MDNPAQYIHIVFASHRARKRGLAALGLVGAQCYYSFKRDTGQGVYLLTIDQVTYLKEHDIKGWRKLRGPFDDIHPCINW